MTKLEDVTQKLSPKRLIIPVLFGLLAASWLLYSNLTSPVFEQVDPGLGNYSWVDGNADGVVDLENEAEFALEEGGDYVLIKPYVKLSSINWTGWTFFWIFISVLMVVFRDLGYMIRIRLLTDNQLSWRQSFDTIMLWEFASALTPSVVGGSGLAVFILKREGISLGRSTAVVLVTALLDELFYIITVPIVFLLIPYALLFPEVDYVDVKSVFMLGFGFILFLTISISLGVFMIPRAFKYFLLKIFSLPILRKWRKKVGEVGDEIIVASKTFRGKPFVFWLKAFGATFFSWTARYWVVNCLMMAFFVVDDHLLVYARQLVMWVIMLISPTPGGSGIAEVAFSSFLRDQMDLAFVGALALVWRLMTYYPYLFVGVIILPKWLKRTAKKKT
ncbi:MAG: hypothetical protein ACJAY8_001467 [Sphingobacteriales bacterium]|jgi:uncharacterized protein (TIRG00374 family)